MDIEKLRDYVRLRRREAELKAQMESIKDEADGLQHELMEQFGQDGVSSINVDGVTVYLHRQLWAGAADGVPKDTVVEVLKSVGLGHFVTESFNVQTLSSYVRDLEREEEPLPDELADVINVREVYGIRTRRAG